ncbi:hypothetical protein D3C72_1445410 [compost metagenome]
MVHILQFVEYTVTIHIFVMFNLGHDTIDTIGNDIMDFFGEMELCFFDLILCLEFKPLLAALVP